MHQHKQCGWVRIYYLTHHSYLEYTMCMGHTRVFAPLSLCKLFTCPTSPTQTPYANVAFYTDNFKLPCILQPYLECTMCVGHTRVFAPFSRCNDLHVQHVLRKHLMHSTWTILNYLPYFNLFLLHVGFEQCKLVMYD